MKNRVLAFVTNNIASDQRLHKVGTSLQNHDFDFELIGTNLRGTPQLNTPFATTRFKLLSKKGFLFYAEVNLRIFGFLLFKNLKHTILLANDLDTLLPVYIIAKLKNKPLVFDSHEIFSHLPSLRKNSVQAKVWIWLEKLLLPKLKYFYTVSDGYAKWFEKQYGVQAEVIRNVPKQLSELPIHDPNGIQNKEKIILIYQGALNPHRGIERMIAAMEWLPSHELWIVGDGPERENLQNLALQMPFSERVVFHGFQAPEVLKNLTNQADIGLSLEEANNISYQLALPNKVFDYLHAGIPVLVSEELPEVAELVKAYDIGKTVINRSVQEIVDKILEISHRSFELENFEKAQREFNWENQEERLIKIFRQAARD